MRTPKFLLLALAIPAAFTFTSCDPDDVITIDPVETYELRIIDFESAELDETGVLGDESYEEKGMNFVNDFTDWGGGMTSWYGFAVSDNTDMETPGYPNQYSVYGDGGYDGSEKFGVAYESAFMGPETCFSTFGEGAEYEIEYAWMTNSTYTYLALKNGEAPATAFGDGDWFLLTITGFDAEGDETGAVKVYLADFRDGKSFIMTEWTKVDLTSLGAVNKLVYKFTSTDSGAAGINTPTYVCIDNVAYREYLTTGEE